MNAEEWQAWENVNNYYKIMQLLGLMALWRVENNRRPYLVEIQNFSNQIPSLQTSCFYQLSTCDLMEAKKIFPYGI